MTGISATDRRPGAAGSGSYVVWPTSTDIDILRDGGVIAAAANDGAFTDHINQRGGGSYVYQVCEAGTMTCSNEATLVF